FEGRIVALKLLMIDNPEELKKEAEISRQCDHPNVLQTIGVCDALKSIITEFMDNGSLKKYVQMHYLLPSAVFVSIAQKIASGMAYLESLKIVHRDLSARNILIGHTIDNIKISDFGLSRTLEDKIYYPTQKDCFPMAWTAPEGFVGEGILPS
ncbi:hypothetical protein PENTCL1PPCAC_12883, partial [Pristionchus entomophagus]